MLEINRNPSPREQLQFVAIWLPAFFALVGAVVYWRLGTLAVAAGIWTTGLLLTIIGLVLPSLRRPLYVTWMYAAYPIGWTVSHLVLVLVYYLVITPIGWAMRLAGYDPMERRLDPRRKTYWVRRPLRAGKKSSDYFRQW